MNRNFGKGKKEEEKTSKHFEVKKENKTVERAIKRVKRAERTKTEEEEDVFQWILEVQLHHCIVAMQFVKAYKMPFRQPAAAAEYITLTTSLMVLPKNSVYFA